MSFPSGIKDVRALLEKKPFSSAQIVHLDRTKGKSNRAVAKTFAAKVDSALSGFQDKDVYLIALTVDHKH